MPTGKHLDLFFVPLSGLVCAQLPFVSVAIFVAFVQHVPLTVTQGEKPLCDAEAEGRRLVGRRMFDRDEK